VKSTGVKAPVLFPAGVWGGSYDTTQERIIYKKNGIRYARFNGNVFSLEWGIGEDEKFRYVAVCLVKQ